MKMVSSGLYKMIQERSSARQGAMLRALPDTLPRTCSLSIHLLQSNSQEAKAVTSLFQPVIPVKSGIPD
jgi:hypothetical protein